MSTLGSYPISWRASDKSASVRRVSPSRGGVWTECGAESVNPATISRIRFTEVGSRPPADVQHRPARLLGSKTGQQVGLDHVIDEREIAGLLAVPVDLG